MLIFYLHSIKIHNTKVEPGSTKYCLDTLSKEHEAGVYPCQNGGGNQLFSFSKNYELRNDALCLFASSSSLRVEMRQCSGAQNEKWSHTKSSFIRHTLTGNK